MRPNSRRRAWPRHAVVGALALGTIGSITATTLASAHSGSTAGSRPARPSTPATAPARLAMTLQDRHLHYGDTVVAHGRLGAASAGVPLALQYARRGGTWHTVGTTRALPDGSYRATTRVRASGAVRVVRTEAAVAEAQPTVSRSRRVAVAANLVVKRASHKAELGDRVRLAGTLLPRGGGRHVVIEGRMGGHWRAVARIRTRRNGHFDAHVHARSVGTTPLRVAFAGDRVSARAAVPAGALSVTNPFSPSVASWYADYGGPLACGGTLGFGTMGVANKSLPCGTQVTIRYRGRQVTVPVIDRGPYIAGRTWDLTGATARALGFDGVGTVYTDH